MMSQFKARDKPGSQPWRAGVAGEKAGGTRRPRGARKRLCIRGQCFGPISRGLPVTNNHPPRPAEQPVCARHFPQTISFNRVSPGHPHLRGEGLGAHLSVGLQTRLIPHCRKDRPLLWPLLCPRAKGPHGPREPDPWYSQPRATTAGVGAESKSDRGSCPPATSQTRPHRPCGHGEGSCFPGRECSACFPTTPRWKSGHQGHLQGPSRRT